MAYINPQIQLDMQQQERSDNNYRSIGNALTNSIQLFQENRRRALDEKRKQDLLTEQKSDQKKQTALALAKDGHSQEDITKYLEDGDSSGIFGKYAQIADEARKAKLQEDELNRDVKKSTIAANEATAREKSLPYGQSREGQAFKFKADYEHQLKQNEAASKGNSEELEVPGYGQVKTKKEAIDIRAAKADAEDAAKLIDQLKGLGTNVAIWDRDKISKINQLKTVLAGKLRLPLTGPGAMTEDEFQRLVSNIGDPSNLLSTEEIEHGKLDQLKDILTQTVQSKFASAASNKQPGMYQAQQNPQRVAPELQQKVNQTLQQMTPEQKEQMRQQLRAKKAGVAMGGN